MIALFLYATMAAATLQPATQAELPRYPVQVFRYDGNTFQVNGETLPATTVAAWSYDGRTMRLVRRETVFISGFDG